MNVDWLVGFFEGEGSMSGYTDAYRSYKPRIQISQKDLPLLERLQEWLATEYEIHSRIGLHKQSGCHYLQVDRNDAVDKFIILVRPRMQTTRKVQQMEEWSKKWTREFPS